MSYSGIRILTIFPGAWPWMAILSTIIGVGGIVRKGLPLLEPSGLPSWGGLPFLSSPRWRGRGFFFLLVVFRGGVRFGVVGR